MAMARDEMEHPLKSLHAMSTESAIIKERETTNTAWGEDLAAETTR
jgi:hypothetical protein